VVLNYCKYRLKHTQDAEDITNNSFFKLWNQRRFIRPETVIAYVNGITRNSCTDLLRRRKIMVDKYPLNGLEGEYEDHTEDRLFIKELEKIINDLPAQQARLIKMKYFEGIGPGKISEILGLSDSTIRNQLCTGLKNIRKRIKSAGYEVPA